MKDGRRPREGAPPVDATIGIQRALRVVVGGLGARLPGTQAPRRHASRGVLCVECPSFAYEALTGEDGCFSAAPPLAGQEFVTPFVVGDRSHIKGRLRCTGSGTQRGGHGPARHTVRLRTA